jgi:TRAP-type mannitol/chloroaromatic compound transport system permease small subunit
MRLVHWIDGLSEKLASLVSWALLLNALLITFNAISRKVFSVAWSSAFDMQWHFFAAVVFITAAYALQKNEHVRVDVFANRIGEWAWPGLICSGLFLSFSPYAPASSGKLW